MFIFIDSEGAKHYPVNNGSIQKYFPNTSFPTPLPEEGFPEMGIYPLDEEPLPEYDTLRQDVVQVDPVEDSEGQWKILWSIVDLSEEKISSNVQIFEHSMRDNRNSRLAVCDWTQLTDAPVDKAAWASYRQELRDITTEEAWPENITWPTQPS